MKDLALFFRHGRRIWSGVRWVLESVATCPLCDTRAFAPCVRCAGEDPLRTEVAGLPVYHHGTHEGRLAERIIALKHHETTAHAYPIGYLFGASLRGLRALEDVILVPVPLHPERLVERGYNQSALIAQGLADALDVSVASSLLERTRATSKQAHLDERGRLGNLSGAFFARRGIRNRPLWLVDDVCTTGATLEHCINALRNADLDVRGALTLSCSISRGSRAARLERGERDRGTIPLGIYGNETTPRH